jgi:hypothetical protein
MKPSLKNTRNEEWNRKISEGVKRQHREGRGRSPGFSDEQRKKGRDTNWKGETASLKAIHQWVYLWKGRPLKCEKCGEEGKKKYEWANINHEYKRDLADYIRMCTSCHRLFDIEHNNYKK